MNKANKDKEPIVALRQYKLRDERTIPRRPWLMPGLLMRKQVAALVAAGGVGKSITILTVAMHLAAGRAFGPWKCLDKYSVALLSCEEDDDETDRRLHAIRKHYGFSQDDADRLFLIKADSEPILARADANGLVQPTKLLEKLENEARISHVDAVFLDPLIELLSIPENDNSSMRAASGLVREMARNLDIAVLLTHHTRKGSTSPGDIDASRGASSLAGLVRTGHTLLPMAEHEAKSYGLDPDEAAGLFRCDSAKQNYSPRSGRAYWFRFMTVTLDNANDDGGGDEVGVPVRWQGSNPLFEKSYPEITRILKLIDAGNRDGDRYGFKRSGNSRRWVGQVFADEWDCNEVQATEIIDIWKASGMLYENNFLASGSRGNRRGVFVDWSKNPDGEGSK